MLPEDPIRLWERVRRARLVQILGVYVGGCFAVLQAIDIFTTRLGLPDWVFVSALVLLVIGMPVVVATALSQSVKPKERGGAPAGETASTGAEAGMEKASGAAAGGARGVPAGAGRPPRLTWRRTFAAGLVGFGGLGVVVVLFMGMRVFGIGPIGSLIARGVLDERDRILIADFESQTGDAILAGAVTEAFRVDFEQSPVVTLVPPASVSEALRRMGRSPETALDPVTARELARREGVKAVVSGEVNAAGSSIVVSARLLAADDGAVLASFRETAADSSRIIAAVDRLSKSLRQRIGESLRTIRANDPLDRVTTPSLEALLRYSQAVRAADMERDLDKAVALLEEAVALDSTFAMAYRKLGVVHVNRGDRPREARAALTRAYAHRDRLTDRERYLAIASYHSYVEEDVARAITAYRTVLDLYPDEVIALNNLAILYGNRRDFAAAEALLRRAIDVDSSVAVRYTNLVVQLAAQGRFAAADSVLDVYRRRFPDHPHWHAFSSNLAFSRGRYDDAARIIERVLEQTRDPRTRADASLGLMHLDLLHGRLAAARDKLLAARTLYPDLPGLGDSGLFAALQEAWVELYVMGDDEAAARVENALRRYPLAAIDSERRPYGDLVAFFALAGRPDRARDLLREWRENVVPERRDALESSFVHAEARIAGAEGRYDDAIRLLRRVDAESPCPICQLPELGLVYWMAGQPDSTIAVGERYLETPHLFRAGVDATHRPRLYRMLGEAYERKGDPLQAAAYYSRFADLWADADPELQPQVDAARRAAARLLSEAGR